MLQAMTKVSHNLSAHGPWHTRQRERQGGDMQCVSFYRRLLCNRFTYHIRGNLKILCILNCSLKGVCPLTSTLIEAIKPKRTPHKVALCIYVYINNNELYI